MIREAILKAWKKSGQTAYRVSQETGISPAALSRFKNGERGLSMETLDILLKYFGLRVIATPRKKKR